MKNEIDYILIGNRIKQLRNKLELTQESLAEACCLDTSTIQKIEAGDRGMKISTLIPICKQIGVSADYILFGEIPFSTEPTFKWTRDFLNNTDQHTATLLNDFINAIANDIKVETIVIKNSK